MAASPGPGISRSLLMAHVARNDPCPCGSGRRYKECHGAFEAAPAEDSAAGRAPSPQADLASLMRDALAAQQEGRLADAIAKYEAVLSEQPRNFDALHMLGVAWYQRHQLDRAEEYVDRALAVRPDVAAAQSNRALIAHGRRLAREEADLCRRVLRKMSPLSADRPTREGEERDLVIAARELDADDLSVIGRLAGDPRFVTTTWRTPLTSALPGLETIPRLRTADTGSGPESESMLVYGLDIPAAAWMPARVPARVALLINADLPCQLLDRLRELSDQGRSPIAIVFNRAELRSSAGIRGRLLEEWLAEAPVR